MTINLNYHSSAKQGRKLHVGCHRKKLEIYLMAWVRVLGIQIFIKKN